MSLSQVRPYRWINTGILCVEDAFAGMKRLNWAINSPHAIAELEREG
jgi:hypothetical protein